MISYKVTDYYKSISVEGSPLWKQYTPDDREHVILPYETSDPLDENKHMVVPRLVHRYKDRVLLLVTDQCAMYCRHCFRRDYVNRDKSTLNNLELNDICNYIISHKEVHEVLISGGDPLILQPQRLEEIIRSLKKCRKNLVIRIGTRVPIIDPNRITNAMVDVLKKHTPIWISLQCNHALEITPNVENTLKKLCCAGINLVNQSVLLKGVNDSVKTLKELSYKLIENGVKPYYIFQGDLARGTSHFRVPVTRGLEIMKELRSEISGLAMPNYAVDIPGGGGKVLLNKDFIVNEDYNYIYLKNREGFIGKYPKEIE